MAGKNKTNGARGALVAAGVFLLTKLKFFIPLLKFLKLHTLVTMFVSLGAYAMFYGWSFAAGLIYLLFIHEMGHLVAAKRKGIPTSPAIFIPFMGAAIGIDPNKIQDARTEAYIAYGGPLFGLFSIIPLLVLYFTTKDPYWALMVQVGGMINLFNLIPVSPLDGGRIVTVLSTKIWFLGLVGLGIFAFLSGSPIMFLIMIFGILTWWNRLRESFKLKEIELNLQILNKYTLKAENVLVGLASLPPAEIDLYSDTLFTDEIFKTWKSEVATEWQLKVNERERNLTLFQKRTIPFLQDDKKLRKLQAELEYEYARKFKELQKPVSRKEMKETISSILAKFNETRKELEGEMKKVKTYYVTDLKTKLSVLALYLLLGVILAFAVNFGMEIMEQHPELRNL